MGAVQHIEVPEVTGTEYGKTIPRSDETNASPFKLVEVPALDVLRYENYKGRPFAGGRHPAFCIPIAGYSIQRVLNVAPGNQNPAGWEAFVRLDDPNGRPLYIAPGAVINFPFRQFYLSHADANNTGILMLLIAQKPGQILNPNGGGV